MDNKKELMLLRWALAMHEHSRKPHRKAPECTDVASDLASILILCERRKTIAERYNDGKQFSTDESVEQQIVEKLQGIGKKYGWVYGSPDMGVTGVFVVEHASPHIEISIPIGD